MLVAMAERRSEQGPCIHTKNEVTGMGSGSGKILLTVLTLMNYVLKLANFFVTCLLHIKINWGEGCRSVIEHLSRKDKSEKKINTSVYEVDGYTKIKYPYF